MGVGARARWVSKWRDWILDHGDELLDLVQQESGKSWGDANIEILATDVANYWIEHAAEFLAEERVRPAGPANMAKRLTIVYEPYPAGRRDHALELPPGDAPAGHCTRVDGGLRRAVEAVRTHPAGLAGGGRRVEGDRCARRPGRRLRGR